jgi:hypothetical protein
MSKYRSGLTTALTNCRTSDKYCMPFDVEITTSP